jgi:hypothetical protein
MPTGWIAVANPLGAAATETSGSLFIALDATSPGRGN